MGLFSSKKTITVSSTLYNMAGDENDRPDFLKGTIFGSTMSNSPSLADDITGSYFNGPGMKQRQFFRWANRQNLTGMPVTSVQNASNLDTDVVKTQIPLSPTPAGLQMNVTTAEVSEGDFEPFIQKWILENYPIRIVEDWLGEYDPATSTFSVQFPNGDFYSWLNAGEYDSNAAYVVAKYVEFLDDLEQPVVTGPTNSVETLPSLSGFTKMSDTGTTSAVTLVRNRTTTYTYSNGDPAVIHEDNVPANVAGVLDTDTEVWERIVYISGGLNQEGERQIWNLTATDYVVGGFSSTSVNTTDLGGGVIRTETSVTTGEQVRNRWNTRYDTQFVSKGVVIGGDQIFIYRVGTGNPTLDALVGSVDASDFQEFFPFIPVRLDNQSIKEPVFEDLYAESTKAYRRAFNKKSFSSLVDSVEENEDIDDIDYAYVMFGCSLNVKENACKKYIYKFFENMVPFQQAGSGNAMTQLAADVSAYNTALNSLQSWESTNFGSTGWNLIPNKPELPKITPPATNTIRLNVASLGYDIRLQWIHIEINQYTGNLDSDVITPGNQFTKTDDLIIRPGPTYTWNERTSFNTDSAPTYDTNSIPSVYIYWQISATTYRRMQIWGLTHYNYVYKGKSVKITSAEALADDEESGFVIPLHYPTMSDMNIVDYTQMSTANTHILFNTYEVTKQRWYQRGIFKLLLVILIIVIAVVVFPGAFSAGGGLLGGNLALGGALGLTGTAALVAGVVSNYIASIIISQVLSIVGTELFGEKWGAVFAAIAGFALSMGISGQSLFSAKGILGLGNAVANGYSGYVQGDIKEMQEDLEDDRSDYDKQMDEIQDLIAQLGGNDLNFNPMFLTDSASGNGRSGSGGYLPETADEYIRRTTMTGSDVVDITFSMVYDFVDVQKTLPRN